MGIFNRSPLYYYLVSETYPATPCLPAQLRKIALRWKNYWRRPSKSYRNRSRAPITRWVHLTRRLQSRCWTRAFSFSCPPLGICWRGLGWVSSSILQAIKTNSLWQKAARSWPNNRGIFHNKDKTVLSWVNEEDHCRIISMENGGNIKSVFERFSLLSTEIQKSVEANGKKLSWNEKLGFLG